MPPDNIRKIKTATHEERYSYKKQQNLGKHGQQIDCKYEYVNLFIYLTSFGAINLLLNNLITTYQTFIFILDHDKDFNVFIG